MLYVTYMDVNQLSDSFELCRYLAEFQNGDTRKESAAKALEAYSSASTIANQVG